MTDKNYFCADIGSTWIKAAIINCSNNNMARIISRFDVPTTPEDLNIGFKSSLEGCLSAATLKYVDKKIVSSSAKGGLGIVAVGLVKDLTLQAAKEAAASGGGKILASFSGILSKSDCKTIQNLDPDILLFTGGTERGNRDSVLHNAQIISSLQNSITIVYAGNSALKDEISEILNNFNIWHVGNIMPEINLLSIDDAKRAIREIFLQKIVHGKGLSSIMKQTDGVLFPTPLSVFNFVNILHSNNTIGAPFLLFDPGGATTDLYSASPVFTPQTGYIYKGMTEQEVKRSVEGDLGMKEKDALFCAREALKRHAGKLKRIWTADGEIAVQTGKDLRTVKVVIGSGGYMGRFGDRELFTNTFLPYTYTEGNDTVRSLFPENFTILRDKNYLLPVVALLSTVEPQKAADLFKNSLAEEL